LNDYIKFPALLAPTLALPRKQGREQSPFPRLRGKVGMGGSARLCKHLNRTRSKYRVIRPAIKS